MRSKNILYVSLSPELGGAERSLVELAAELPRDLWTPVIAAPLRNRNLYLACEAAKIPYVSVPMPNFAELRKAAHVAAGISDIAKAVRALCKHIKSRQIDLVHANGAKAALCALPAARRCGVPCVWHARDYPRYFRIERIIGRFADAIIVPSNFMRNALLEHNIGRGRKINVVPNGVRKATPSAAEIEEIRRKVPAPEGTLIITMVAQMAPWKRHDVFLEAVAILRRHTDLPFYAVIAGSDLWGRETDYVAALRQRSTLPDLQGIVTFLGQIPTAAPLLGCSDIVVLPSDQEPFGRVVVEAWHASKPIIVTDLGCPSELVKDQGTGMVFSHGDAAALARHLKTLLSTPQLRCALGQNGNLESNLFMPGCFNGIMSVVYSKLIG